MKSLLLLLALLAAPAFAADRVIINPDQDGDIKVKVNKGGVITDALTVTGSTGIVSIPTEFTWKNPSLVRAYRNSSLSPAGGSGLATVVFDAEFIDKASEYNISTGIFTAQKAGIYFVSFGLRIGTTGTASTSIFCGIYKNDTTALYINRQTDLTASKDYHFNGSMAIELAASDTLRVKCDPGNEQVNIDFGIGGQSTWSITYVGVN